MSSSLRGVQELVERSKRGLAKHTETLKVLTTNKADLEQSKNFKVLKDEQLEEASKKWDALNEALNKIEHLKDFGTHLSEALKKNEEKLIDSNKTLAQTKDKLAALRPLELENKLQDNDKLAIGLQALSIGVSNFQTEAERGAKEIKSLNLKLEETRSRLGKVQEKFDNEKNRIEAQKELIKGAQKAHARLICLQESIEKSQCVLCDSEQIEGVRAKADELKVQDFTLAQASIEEFEKEHENTFQELQRERSAHSALLAQLEQIKEKQKGAFSSLLADHLSSLSFIGQDGARPNIEDIEGSLVGHKKELETQKQDLRKKLQEATELSGRLQHLGKSIEDFKEEAEKLRPQHEQTQRDYRTHKTKADLLWADLQKIFGNLEISEIKACLLCANEAKNLDSKIRIEQKEGELIEERLKNAQKGLEETSASLKRASEEMLFLEKKVKETCGEQSPEEAIKRLEKEAHVIELKRKTIERDLKELEMEKSALFSRRQTFEEQRRDLENMGLKLWGEKRSELNGEFFSSEELIGLLKGLNKTDKAPSGEELELAHKLSEKDYQEAKETLEIAKGQLSEYRAILKRQESAKDQIKQLSKELNQLESQKEAWEELYLLIGKDEFRNYVLAMVEKLLIQQTNAELTKLCDGRYLIQHKASSSRLAPDFYIIDKFRGDETRKVSTLSGGETFMVSLAMALALAELTRGNADIDSFFIDEGFGTLDRDSLEEALEMLQDIETRGKQIGLISHVKELTNRIPVNIHLQKNRLGNSSIDIVYN